MAKRYSYVVVDELFKLVNRSPSVQNAVRSRAQRIANKARSIDSIENMGRANFTLEEKTLPNGRYVCLIGSDDVSGEFGDTKTKRRATLRRARAVE